MNDQYFTQDPTSESRPVSCFFPYRGIALQFMTDSGVFSRGEMDEGTVLLLNNLPELHGDVLDMGCGWGAIGVSIAKKYPACHVTMTDVNRRALGLCKDNLTSNGAEAEVLESDGFAALQGRCFDYMITNPPIRAGKQVIYAMFANGAKALKDGGEMYIVIRKQQGAESCMKYLKTLFGQVERIARDNGFWILRASQAIRDV